MCTLIPTHIFVSYAMMLVLYPVFVQTLMATVYSLHGTEVGIYIGFTLRSLNSVHCLSHPPARTVVLESHGINQCLEVRRLGNVIRQSSFPTLIPDPSLILHHQHSRRKGRRRT